MLPKDICIIIPTRKRPQWLERVVKSLDDTAPDCPVVVVGDPDDSATCEVARRLNLFYVQTTKPKLGCANAWNAGLAAYPNYAAYITGADDLIFRAGWLEATLEALELLGGSGLVGFNDGRKDGNLKSATHFLMTRDFIIEHHGGVLAIPHYTGEMTDLEANQRAKRAGKFAWARDAHVFHAWQGGPTGDETYRLAWDRAPENRKTYKQREALGFPDDFEPVLKSDTTDSITPQKGKGRRGKSRK